MRMTFCTSIVPASHAPATILILGTNQVSFSIVRPLSGHQQSVSDSSVKTLCSEWTRDTNSMSGTVAGRYQQDVRHLLAGCQALYQQDVRQVPQKYQQHVRHCTTQISAACHALYHTDTMLMSMSGLLSQTSQAKYHRYVRSIPGRAYHGIDNLDIVVCTQPGMILIKVVSLSINSISYH